MRPSGVYKRGDLDLVQQLLEVVRSDFSGKVGAFLVFVGVVRGEGKDRKGVVKLEMESYEEHANAKIKEICTEVKEQFGVEMVSIQHLIGQFDVGELVVLVAVGGGRREQVFRAMEESVRRYKSEPALFKKEIYLDGGHDWIG